VETLDDFQVKNAFNVKLRNKFDILTNSADQDNLIQARKYPIKPVKRVTKIRRESQISLMKHGMRSKTQRGKKYLNAENSDASQQVNPI
jgi:hypothetical protein